MPERINSSNVRVRQGEIDLIGVNALDFSTERSYEGIVVLGGLSQKFRVQNAPIESTITLGWILGEGSSDPFFDLQTSGIMSVEKLPQFRIRDELGALIFSRHFLTEYSISCGVGQLIEGNATFVGIPPTRDENNPLTPQDQTNHRYAPSIPAKVFISGFGPDSDDLSVMPIQSFDLSFSIEREPRKHLGQTIYDVYRPILPINGKIDVSILKNQDLSNHLNPFDIDAVLPTNEIHLSIGGCDGEHYEYIVEQASLVSLSEGISLDGDAIYSAQYEFSIGPSSNQNLIFVRGSGEEELFYILSFDGVDRMIRPEEDDETENIIGPDETLYNVEP
jgi:hypothetical protein